MDTATMRRRGSMGTISRTVGVTSIRTLRSGVLGNGHAPCWNSGRWSDPPLDCNKLSGRGCHRRSDACCVVALLRPRRQRASPKRRRIALLLVLATPPADGYTAGVRHSHASPSGLVPAPAHGGHRIGERRNAPQCCCVRSATLASHACVRPCGWRVGCARRYGKTEPPALQVQGAHAVRRRNGAMGRLDGKVALISGGARGQGAVEAQLFAREGAKVLLGDLLDEAGKQVEEAIRQEGGEATYVHLDVTSEADWVEAVGTAVNRYGTLHILVNNAGMSGASPSGEQVRLEDATEAAWNRVLDVNAKGVFLGTKQAIPAMRQAGGGSIINISSIAGLVGFGPSSGAYAASKGAVRLLTKSTATQYAKDGIRCNSVHPGFIDTPMT